MMNFRGRLVPPLPASYFGNAVYCAHHTDESLSPLEGENEYTLNDLVLRMATLASMVHNDLIEQV